MAEIRMDANGVSIDIDIDIENYLDEVSDIDLVTELRDRGITVLPDLGLGGNGRVKQELCNRYGIAYHTEDDKILKLIAKEL